MITKPKIHIDLKQVESLAANGLTHEQIASALAGAGVSGHLGTRSLMMLRSKYNLKGGDE